MRRWRCRRPYLAQEQSASMIAVETSQEVDEHLGKDVADDLSCRFLLSYVTQLGPRQGMIQVCRETSHTETNTRRPRADGEQSEPVKPLLHFVHFVQSVQ